MKLLKIFGMELTYQLRHASTWIYFGVVFAIAFLTITSNYSYDARDGYFLLNAPIVIACVTVVCCLFWLLMGASVAGEAAARDVQTRMFSLTYTAPAGKTAYLGGRFLAAFALNAGILLAIPSGILLALYATGFEAGILGPFRPGAYLNPWFLLVLPNVFIVTAIQFFAATLGRKAMAAYLGTAVLFIAAFGIAQALQTRADMRDLARMIDPIGFSPVLSRLNEWSPVERNTRLIEPEGALLANRIAWIFLSLGMLAFTWFRFRFKAPSAGISTRRQSSPAAPVHAPAQPKWGEAIPLPKVRGTFGFATQLYQLRFITLKMFGALAKKPTGLLLLALIALLIGFAMPGNLAVKGVPLLPRTDQVLQIITAPVTEPGKFWTIIFLLTIFYAGELVWRERESGLSELANAAPVPEWLLFLSRFLSLGLILLTWLVFLLLSGMLAQKGIGGSTVEPGIYLKVLFGFQFIECLLFALLALAVHTIINQKYIGHLAVLLIFGSLVYAPSLGLEHKLLVFGSGPRWSYTSMGGLGASVAPWLWFKVYWLAWALLLAVMARLLWVRGRDESLKGRLQLIRHRFTPATAWITAVAAGLILTVGGFIFYNTNILNHYSTASELEAKRASYERQYGKYRNTVQPRLTAVNLNVEIYPEQREMEITGSYLLVNDRPAPIRSVHLDIPAPSETSNIVFSKPVTTVPESSDNFIIYTLQQPLEPGDTLQLDFKVRHQARGFTNKGADATVQANGTKFRNYEWLPAIGYQSYRELDQAGLRKKYGLAPRQAASSLYDLQARNHAPFAEHISFNAVVGTDQDQVAVAPGTLRQTWKKGKRRYFHYVTDTPIRNEYSFFSANYALHVERWISSQDREKFVDIQIYFDPGNTRNIARMAQSIKASLDYYSSQFGAYPHRQLRFMAYPGYSGGNHAAPINITAEEGFFLLDPKRDPRGFDLVTAVVAHEVSHQWWGNRLKSANVEGAGLLSESLAWYSAMGMLEEKYGPEQLKKLLGFLQEEYENPRTKAALPLLQATDWYHYYRKGPFALHALSRYIGRNRVNAALSSLLHKHPPGKRPMPTSLDLYRELQAVTPDSVRYLLHDLFEKNTFWELKAKQASVKQVKAASPKSRNELWQVSLDVQARKLIVDQRGAEKEVPLADWIEVGIFARASNAEDTGEPVYLKKHRLTSNRQTITITVPVIPSRVGIDPNHLLIDWDMKNNFVEVKK